MSTHRTIQLDPDEGNLRDARAGLDYALRHGNPGEVARWRRYLAECEAKIK